MKSIILRIVILSILSIDFVFAQNNALDFDGSDDYVTLSNSLYTSNLQGQTELTIEYWFKGSQLQSAVRFQDGSYIVAGWSDPPQFIISNDGGISGLVISEDVEDNKWHHIACVWESNTINGFKTYVDGVLTNQKNSANVTLPNISSGAWIGSYGSSGERLDGELDEVRIWNIARTETQIRQNMYRELPTPSAEANLIAYYQMNGDLLDASSNNYTGSFNGGTALYKVSSAFFGPKNCLDFSGSGEDVYSDLISSPSSVLTIEANVKFTSISGQQNFLHLNDGNNNKRIVPFLSPDHTIGFFAAGSDGSGEVITSASTVSANTWYHLAFVYNNQNLKIYIDGKLEASQGISKAYSLDGTDRLYLGSDFGTGSYEFYGFLDEVRVWNIERTAQQIRANMYKSLSGNESNLIAYYNFDNSSGSVLQDFSSYSNDGTLNDMSNSDWVSSSAFNTWLNTSSTTWSSTSNWSRGSVPGSSDNVHIEQLTSLPTNSSDLTINNFVLASNSALDFTGSMTINGNAFFYSPYNIYSGKGMTVGGDFYFDNSKNTVFTVKSGGSLITNGNVSGSINIEHSMTDNYWHLVSVPVSGLTANEFFGDYLQYFDESLSEYNYIDIEDESTILNDCQGYAWRNYSKSDFSFSGTPITGEKSIALTANNVGWNLIGNPYPSAIDWDVLNDTYGAIYIWNPTTDDYIEWNGSSEYAVAPMQAFFVKALSNGTFTIDDNSRTHTNANGFYKSAYESIENGIVLSTNQSDRLTIRFAEEAKPDFDLIYDAFKIVSLGENNSQLYSKYYETKLAIDCRPETDNIQLGYQNNQNGNYTIEMVESDGITAELEDTKLNQFHDLYKGAYTFDWNTTDSEERFILHLKATGTEELDEQDVQVYAANGQVYLRIDEPENYQEVIFYDLAGRVLFKSKLSKQSLQNFDFNYYQGAILVQLKGNIKTRSKKVVL